MRPFAVRFAVWMLLAGAMVSPALAQSVVTAVTLSVDPGYRKQQGCPVTVEFVGTISVNGPALVKYRIVRSDGGRTAIRTIELPQGGTQVVRETWTLGDATTLPTYTGWMAIQVLTPNPVESNHGDATFTMLCGIDPPPTVEPRRARFRVTLTGFHAWRQTRDHLLERDGPGDEIFQDSFALVVDRDGSSRYAYRGPGPVFGRIFTDRQFPGTPASALTAPPVPGGFPGLLFEGELIEGQRAVVIVPTLWEWDGRGAEHEIAAREWSAATEAARGAMVAETVRIMTSSTSRGGLHTPIDGLMTLTLDREGDFHRPIGITLAGRGSAQFRPQALVLTYEDAMAAVSNAFFDGDLFGFSFVDPPSHQGNYSAFVKVELVP